MPMNAIELSLYRLQVSRNITTQRIIDKQLAEDSAQEFSGVHIGHDTKTGEDIIFDGTNTFNAIPISNGWVNSGNIVSVNIPANSSHAITDRMPK